MFVVISDEREPSLKARFIIHLIKLNLRPSYLYVFRDEEAKFGEEWGADRVKLATSFPGIMAHFMLLIMKPGDLYKEIAGRLLNRNVSSTVKINFLYVLSQSLSQLFAKSSKKKGLVHFLEKQSSQKIFLIDEFFSLRVVSVKELRNLGFMIYVSSDLGYDFFGENFLARKLMYKLERDAVSHMDIIIACSERDKLKYLSMGAKKAIFYPNIYPVPDFEPLEKDQIPSISIILREHWGSRAHEALKEVFEALAYFNKPISVYMIGVKPKEIPRNVLLHYYDYVPSRVDMLKILSKSWVGINLGIHRGGSNQRKYDYAIAGTIVLSDTLGSRGDMLPHEYTYVDDYDFAAKLDQLLRLGYQKLAQMGLENRKHALSLATECKEELLKLIRNTPLSTD